MNGEQDVRWAGLDWGDESHTVCVVDGSGKQLGLFTVAHTAEGLEELVVRLRSFGAVAGVAVETTRHLVVHKLSQAGFVIYAINPKISAAWRKAWTVAGSKSDAGDTYTLAEGLSHRHQHLARLEPDDAATRELALLCADESTFIAERSGLANRLKATLKQYYPTALEWFSDCTAPAAWDFVLTFPTADKLTSASKNKLCRFLAAHHLRLDSDRQARIENRKQALRWSSDEATVKAMSVRAVTTARRLHTLQEVLKEYRRRIEALFARQADAGLYTSLPGAGVKLAPRLLSLMGNRRDRFSSARAPQQLSGAAPVTFQSGNKRHVRFRWACSKKARNSMHQFASCSLQQSTWARAFYDQRRAAGDSHALALRKLAYKWLKIIYRMWQDRKPYDEHLYIASLIRRRSPLAHELNPANQLP